MLVWSLLGVPLGKISLKPEAFLGEAGCPQDAKEKDQEPDGALVAVEEPKRCRFVPFDLVGMLRSKSVSDFKKAEPPSHIMVGSLLSFPLQWGSISHETPTLEVWWVEYNQKTSPEIPEIAGLWCLELLEQTGIVTVPGDGLSQKMVKDQGRMDECAFIYSNMYRYRVTHTYK